MFSVYSVAGYIAVLVSLVHSVLGEKLIFSRMRVNGLVPTNGGSILHQRHVRILWASWHIVSIFGLVFSSVLIALGFNIYKNQSFTEFCLSAISIGMFASALLVFYATQARHPGWIGLLMVAVLCAWG